MTPRFRLASTLVLVAACGDSGTGTASDMTTQSSVTTLTSTDPTTPTTGTPASTEVVDPSTAGSGGLTGTGTSTGEPDTSTSSTSAASTGEPMTSNPVTNTDTGETTVVCACTPGETNGCDGDDILVCSDDCFGFAPQPCPSPGDLCVDGACMPGLACVPNVKECLDADTVQQCNGDGSGFLPPVDCDPDEACFNGECSNLCEQMLLQPSSVGCSFFAARMDNYSYENTDSLVVGNTDQNKPAKVQLYQVPNGGGAENPLGAVVEIPPGGTTTFQLTAQPIMKVSALQKGGTYRVESDIPVIAYQHSPIQAQYTNDASMMLPEHALRQNYVIAAYADNLNFYPSYFNVIATEDNTKVDWVPPQATQAGNGVPAVQAGQTGSVVMNRGDFLQVRTNSGGDITGTRVDADKPIWVVGAVSCVNVPAGVSYCDHIEEQMLPFDYWGKTYVGAHSPSRGNEKHHWRVFGGEDGVTISTDPVQPGTPFMLNKGEWKSLVFSHNTSVIFNGTGPFMPVQYLESQDGGAGTGDPAMYQMIPVEQFLSRYAFVTGTGYAVNYVQIVRTKGGADVLVDGAVVNGYYTVGNYEVADRVINQGAHLATSDMPFGIVGVGYTDATSYAYPGGLKLEIINPQ